MSDLTDSHSDTGGSGGVTVFDPATDPKYAETYRKAEAALASQQQRPALPEIDTAALLGCVVTGDELSGMDIPKRARLLDEWLCRGDLGFIFAPRGVGKTWLGMALPQAVSAGLPLGEWTAGEERARILFVDGEMPLELSRARHAWLRQPGADVAFLHHDILFQRLGRTLNIAEMAHQEAITRVLEETGRDCLVLDNLSCLAAGVDENKSIAYEPIAAWLLDLRRRGITVIFFHHAGREGFMRGSSKREDAASWIIELRDAKEEGMSGARFVSRFAKNSRNTGRSMPALLWHFTTDETEGRTHIHCETAEESEFEAFVRHVQDGVESVSDIADLMGKGRGTVSKWAAKAVERGKIQKAGTRLLPL